MEKTLMIIKPDGVRRNLVGPILTKIEGVGLKIKALRMIHMTLADAQSFYGIHKDRPFFGELTKSMTSGPVIVGVLESDNAIAKYRKVMGATNPEEATKGSIRKEFALNIGENTVHGSDCLENAQIEITHFFSQIELVN